MQEKQFFIKDAHSGTYLGIVAIYIFYHLHQVVKWNQSNFFFLYFGVITLIQFSSKPAEMVKIVHYNWIHTWLFHNLKVYINFDYGGEG